MLKPDRIVRLLIEVIFIFLGGIVVWLGWTGRILFDRRSIPWLALSIALLLWGMRALYQPAKSWVRGENWVRGISLATLGAILTAISRVPFSWVGPLLAAAGIVLVVRGLASGVLLLRAR